MIKIIRNTKKIIKNDDIIYSDKILNDIKKHLTEHGFELKTKTFEGFSVFEKKGGKK